MLILASASPRRRELLTQAGFSFQVHPAHIPEDPLEGEDPFTYVTRLAREKALAVFQELTEANDQAGEGRLDGQCIAVLGADTTVTLDNHILGKPEDPADAARMLRLLSGRTHRVITGVALVTRKAPKLPPKPQRFASWPFPMKRSPPMWPPANPWTRQAPTQSRAARHAGFHASKAAIST